VEAGEQRARIALKVEEERGSLEEGSEKKGT
jgi:hypothetical protein